MNGNRPGAVGAVRRASRWGVNGELEVSGMDTGDIEGDIQMLYR